MVVSVAVNVGRISRRVRLREASASEPLAVADPVIRKLVSPEALSELLAVGWPVAVVQDPPPGTLGLNSDTLGTAWQVFGASRYGLARFEVSAPMALPPANRFRLRFQLLAWRWQLVGIILP